MEQPEADIRSMNDRLMPLVSDDSSCEPPVFQVSFPLQGCCAEHP